MFPDKIQLPRSSVYNKYSRTGQIITVNRSNNDHKTLEPHTDIHHDTDMKKVTTIFLLIFLNQNICGDNTLQPIMIQ